MRVLCVLQSTQRQARPVGTDFGSRFPHFDPTLTFSGLLRVRLRHAWPTKRRNTYAMLDSVALQDTIHLTLGRLCGIMLSLVSRGQSCAPCFRHGAPSSSSRHASSAAGNTRPLKVAIIGSGPSGFYTASRILTSIPADTPAGKDVEVHMYERLPTPYGLVRFGVAPDHPEVKVS